MYTREKTKTEIASMKAGGKICSNILSLLKSHAKPGLTTKDLALIAEKEIKSQGALPAFLGYNGFPDVICISTNNQVVHGIPSHKNIIKSGDIVSLDLGIKYREMIVDSAISIIVGVSEEKKTHLLKFTRESLAEGIKQLHDGCRTGDVGSAIEKVLNRGKLGIVRDLVGHGVGHSVHEEPNIPNYGSPNYGPKLKAGMTVAIEPMATLGGEAVFVEEDGWTVSTQDGSNSAHFEQTVLITKNGSEILTPFL